MPYQVRSVILAAILTACLLMPALQERASGQFDIPNLPSEDEYGNFLINRTSEKNGVKPATFSHWIHRRRHTCRVCHFELEFNMKVNTTEITEEANRAGKFCGAPGCHDGKFSFNHDQPNCEKCHNGDRGYGKASFSRLSYIPKTEFGNKRDWTIAIDKKLIKPLHFLTMKPSGDITFGKRLLLEAEWYNIPPAVFPHRAHTKWLDCNNCHPDIFNIKKKTTKHFAMEFIMKGEFCGVCHLSVAFPINDCRRCHPGMEPR